MKRTFFVLIVLFSCVNPVEESRAQLDSIPSLWVPSNDDDLLINGLPMTYTFSDEHRSVEIWIDSLGIVQMQIDSVKRD